MKLVGIEWDEDKNEKNKQAHEGLGFEEAQYVFADPERLERHDRSEKTLRVKNDGRRWAWSEGFSLWFIQNAGRTSALYLHE
jgi:uncharacterized DUF497 family protein